VSIRLFLADGVAEGLWIIEKSNWTGLALTWPRLEYTAVRQREELSRPGVYVLEGPSESDPTRRRIYVGEADALVKRLDTHHKATDFWTRAVAFTSKDQNLNKAHVKYLESRLIGLASLAARAEVANGNAPQPPALSEADRAEMDGFLDEMLLIYPVIDVRAFELITEAVPDRASRLYLKGAGGALGEGKETPEGFVVFAGSLARATTVPAIHSYMVTLRNKLLADGVLQPVGDGRHADVTWKLTSDYLFGSPSTAAGVLLGRNANGRTEWKDAEGHTLKEIQTAAIQA
jgi:hypothetical protein